MAYDVTPDKLQEVLHVSVDQTQFAEGLSNLLKVWNDFVAKIGSENVGAVVGVGAFESIREQLNAVKNDLQQFQLAMQADSNAAAEAIIAGLARIEEAEAASQARRAARARDTAAQEDSALHLAAAGYGLSEKERAAVVGSGPTNNEHNLPDSGDPALEKTRALNEQLRAKDLAEEQKKIQTIGDLHTTALAEDERRTRALADMQIAAYKEDEARTERKARAEQEMGDLHTAALAEDERRLRERANLQLQATKEDLTRDKQKQASIQKTGDLQTQAIAEDERRIRSLGDMQLAALKEDGERTERKRNELQKMGDLQRAAYAEDEARTRSLANLQIQAEKEDKRRSQEKLDSLKKQGSAEETNFRARERAHEQALAMENKRSQTFLGNLGREFVELAKYQLLWSSFGAVLGGLGKLFSLPFDAIKEGVTYLKEITDVQDKLTGVLGANFKWSSDFVTNMKKAGEASEYVVQKLQDIAIADRLKVTDLTQILESLSQSNATKAVGDMKELVRLSEIFGLAMRSIKLEGNSARAVISEIPKLFTDGLNPESTKFLRALHLNNDQWKIMRQEGERTGNLVQLLAEHMAPYQNASEKSAMHAAAIAESMELVKKRWEGIVARPILEAFTEFMAKVLAWAQEHKAALQEAGEFIGKTLVEAGRFITLTDQWKDGIAGIVSMFAKLALFAERVANTLVTAVDRANQGANILNRIRGGNIAEENDPDIQAYEKKKVALGMSAGGPIGDLKTALGGGYRAMVRGRSQDDLDELKALEDKANQAKLRISKTLAEQDNYDSQIDDRAKARFSKIADNEAKYAKIVADLNKPGSATPDPAIALERVTAGQGQPAKGSKTKPNNRLDRATFNEESLSIREQYQERNAIIREQEAEQIITRREALERTTALNAQELKDLEDAAARYIAALKSTGDQRKTDIVNIHNTVERTRLQMNTQESSEGRSVVRGEVRDDLKERQDKLKREQEIARARLAIEQEFAQQGYATEVDFVEKKIALDKKEAEANVAALRQEIAIYPSRKDLIEKLKQEQTKYTLSYATDTARLKGLNDQRKRDEREFEAAMAQIHSQDKIALLEAEDANRSFKHVIGEVYDEQQRQLSSLIKLKQAELDEAIARNAQTDAVKRLRLELAQLNSTSLNNVYAQLDKIRGSSSSLPVKQVLSQGIVKGALGDAEARRSAASETLGVAALSGAPAEKLKVFTEALDDATKSVESLKALQEDMKPSFDHFKDGLTELFTGSDFDTLKKAFGDAHGPVDKMGVAAGAAANGLNTVLSVIDAYKQGSAKGGVLGGIGGVLGALAPALEKIPVVGQFVGAAASVFSFVGTLFTNAAKKAAENIQKAFSKTMEEFNNGSLDIKDAILQVNEERNQAIRELSGKKGGKDELNKLLPEFDRQLQSLNKTREQTITTFNDGLADLRLHSDTLATMAQTWRDINKQVKDYIAAGGDAASASELITLRLAKIKEDQTSQLSAGEQAALQDAISLNGLLQQKVDLEKQYIAQRFALANADSLERRGVGSIVRGQQIKDQEAANKKQLDDINSQINLATQKVAIEGTMFNLVGSIAELHRRDEALTLQALQLQINKYAEMKNLIGAISVGNLGLVGISTTPSSGSTTVTINGGVNISSPPNMGGPGGDYTPPPGYVGPGPDYRPDAIGRAVAMHVGNEVSKEIARQRRLYPHGAV